jgi:hypothetical protein
MGRHKKGDVISKPSVISDIPVEASTASPAKPGDSPEVQTGDTRAMLEDIRVEGQEVKEEKTRKKYRRRPKKEIEEEKDKPVPLTADQQESVEAFQEFVEMLIDIGVPRLPNPKPLSGPEKQMVTKATSRLMKKYVPMLGEWAVEVEFAGVLIFVLLPRLRKQERRVVEEAKIIETSTVV